MKIGIISDTHGVLSDKVIKNIEDCDYIIHAGDVGSLEIVDKLNSIAKTFIVKGNIDKKKELRFLPEYMEIEMDEVLIYLTHNKADIPHDLKGVHMIVYGHSHKYSEEIIDNILYLNPGGCGKKRFSLPLTMAIVEINLGEIKVKKIELE